MKLIPEIYNMEAKGTAIAAVFAILSGIIITFILVLVLVFSGEADFFDQGIAEGILNMFLVMIGGGGVSLFCFLLFNSPLRHIVVLVSKIPYAGLIFLPFVVLHFILALPGMKVAQQLGLIFPLD